MNTKTFFLLLFGFTLTYSSCIIDNDDFFGCERGEGPIVERELFLSDFSSIDLDIPADVCISQGPEQIVVVEGERNIINELDLDVDNGRWEIEFDDCVRDYEGLKIFITLPFYEQLRISGSGLIFSTDVIVADDLDLRITGSGDIDVALDVEDLTTRITGSGEIRLEGIAEDAEHEINGSGDLEAFDLATEDTDIVIRGSGDAEVLVADRLDVRITGSGDVFFRGNPRLDIDITGSGDVIDAN
ncbi:MAG: head GIN domain-containing protein [Saprospiraceae bacterium]